MKKRMKKVAFYSILIGILGICYGLLFVYNGYGIPCPFFTFFKIQCPGCGISRMFTSLMTFQFKKAFFYNPIAFLLLPVYVFIGIQFIISYIRFGTFKINKLQSAIFNVSIVLFVSFGIIRNLI